MRFTRGISVAVVMAALLVAALFQITAIQSAGSVTMATEATLQGILDAHELSLVAFTAPWCGHCKSLAPEWEKAANEVNEKTAIVKVDCTVEKALAEKYGIQGFPTIKVFSHGTLLEDYQGGRTADAILKYVSQNSGPAVQTIATAEELAAAKEKSLVCVVFSANLESPAAQLQAAVAPKLRSKVSFALVQDASLFGEELPESIVVYKNFDSKREVYGGSADDREDLIAFLNLAQVPYLGEIGPSNYLMYAQIERPTGWLFIEPAAQGAQATLKEMEEVAKTVRANGVVMLFVDASRYGAVGEQLGLPSNAKYPAFLVDISGKHYVMPSDKPVTAAEVQKYIDDVLANKVTVNVRSEPVPEKETTNGLTVAVGRTLDEIVSRGKLTMIKFFATWCGHCKELAPIYEQLAKSYENEDDVLIVEFDAEKNDFDKSKFNVEGYPTIFLVQPNGLVREYSEARNLREMREFIEYARTNPEAAHDHDHDHHHDHDHGHHHDDNEAEGDL